MICFEVTIFTSINYWEKGIEIFQASFGQLRPRLLWFGGLHSFLIQINEQERTLVVSWFMRLLSCQSHKLWVFRGLRENVGWGGNGRQNLWKIILVPIFFSLLDFRAYSYSFHFISFKRTENPRNASLFFSFFSRK